MGWRSETFNEIKTRLQAQVTSLQDIDLFNNQFDDFKSDENEEYPFRFPNAFIALGGGTWSRQPDNIRISTDYIIRIHLGLSTYDDTVTHLDLIDDIANALEKWAGTSFGNIRFIQEFTDEERTNIIEHILEFEGTVFDCSLKTKLDAAQTIQQATDDLIIVTKE